jgi:hypothetical protein
VAHILAKIRFDYPGRAKSGKLFGNKNIEQLADDNRQQKVAKMRNVPMQGIRIDDIDMSQDIYTLVDDITGTRVAYAPVVITLVADRIDELVQFAVMEDFRTIEIIEPGELLLAKDEIEKLIFRVSKESSGYRDHLQRQMDNGR